MGNIKPLGSEKLKGDDKLKRILELTYFGDEKAKKSSTPNKSEYVTESTNNGVYGIVKEKDGYFVKKGLNESSLDYIGGLFMKNKNKFSSYAEAIKRLEFIKGQENLQEATKYILKQKQSPTPPANEQPMGEPSMDEPVPSADPSLDSVPSPEGLPSDAPTSTDPSMGDSSKRSDYMAEVQKFAGKLGQELRDQHQRMESDDIKYVLNMIISAVNLDKLDIEDLEEIGKKFDRDEEGDGEGSTETPKTNNEPAPEVTDDMDEAMSKLQDFVNTPIDQDEEINLSKYADLGSVDEEKEFDLDEITNDISKSIGETLGKYFK